MSIDCFEEFRKECFDIVTQVQEEFMRVYNILSYEHWFYDHKKGAFHFQSKDGRNLYFKYIDIGSFSTETNTWMWSWHNNSVPKHVTKGLEKVREFGIKNNFEKLCEGLIDADEYTGWDLTNIAARLVNAIGVYRVPQDHLFSYFVFTDELTPEQYESLNYNYVTCETHGETRLAFICEHLNKNNYTGFHEAFDSNPLIEPDDDYQAWCDECEKIRLQHDGWNDYAMSFVKLKIVCDQCYFEIKRRNSPTES
jgi:hypothetical protein